MRRLLVRYGVAMASVVLIAFLVPLGLLARTLAEERALGAARQDAQSVAVFAGGPTADDTRLAAAVLAVNDGLRSTTVFTPDGRVLGAGSPRTAAVDLAALGRAVTARTQGGAEVVVPVAGGSGITVVRTFVPEAELRQGVVRSWLVLAGVGVLLLVGTALAGHRIAGRLSRSVLDLSGVADRLGAGDLAARVEPSGPPEVASVGRVLNGLGERVTGLLAAERELVADLSHRLRTPVTALRLDVELLADPQERERMTEHVDQLVAAVDEVIRAAREPRTSHSPRCDVTAVVRARAAFWGVLAADQGRELRLDLPDGPVPAGVTAEDLGAALDVLVDNVFAHTPARTPFTLAVTEHQDRGVVRAVVTVTDEGPGMADDVLAERGRSGAGSTGLGLDVARRTAEASGGRLVVARGPRGGAHVVLELGAAQA